MVGEAHVEGWNKARVLNTTDVHLLAACLPAWCSYPRTADAVPADSTSLFLRVRVCVRAYACVRARARVLVRVVKRGCCTEGPEGRETGGAETTAVGCSCQILRLL